MGSSGGWGDILEETGKGGMGCGTISVDSVSNKVWDVKKKNSKEGNGKKKEIHKKSHQYSTCVCGGINVSNHYFLCQLFLICLCISPLWCVTCVHDTHREFYILIPEGIIFCCWFSLSLYFSYNVWILSFASFATLPRSFPPPSLLNFK